LQEAPDHRLLLALRSFAMPRQVFIAVRLLSIV